MAGKAVIWPFQLSSIFDRCYRSNINVPFTSGYAGDYLAPINALPTGTEFLAKTYLPDALAVKVRKVMDSV